MTRITSVVHDTAPLPPESELPADPLKGVGTLAEQAKRGDKKLKTKLELLSGVIRGTEAFTAIRQLAQARRFYTRPMTSALADVESFTKLIDDRVVHFGQLAAGIVKLRPGDDAKQFRIMCSNPPPPVQDHPSDQLGEKERLLMLPTQTFFQSVTRYVNDKTRVRGLTGSFLASMINEQSLRGRDDSQKLMSNLLNYLFGQVYFEHGSEDELDEWEPKSVMLRTLRPDLSGRWPKVRTCRAILHKGYRDDISHVWLMRLLAELSPTGGIERYLFDGNLLRGAILLPDISLVAEDSDYGGGLFFFSGEVGNRRCGIMPFVYRAISRSVVLIGDSWGVTHHGGADLEKLEAELKKYVHKQIPLVTTHLDRMLAAQNILFNENDSLVVERLLIALGASFRMLTQQDLRLWRVGVFTERKLVPGLALSAFTIQNGISRMSQCIEDPVRQIQLDQLAGDLLDLDWSAIVKRASTVQDDQVHTIFPS